MPQIRKDKLESGHFYHVFSRSIAKFTIFNDAEEYSRFLEIFQLYAHANFTYQYSKFSRLDPTMQSEIIQSLNNEDLLVDIVAFCLMPTHIHFLLRQVSANGISKFMGKILNCYSRFFNIKHRRNGPLFAGRFKSVLVNNDEQLLHLTRYIHLNPYSAGLIDKTEEWDYSSFNGYLDNSNSILLRDNFFNLKPDEYRKFVNDHKDYQRQLSVIKSLIIEDYSG